MLGSWWTETLGSGPLVAVAMHAGHEVSRSLEACLALDSQARLREEDPFTDRWTSIVPNRIVVHCSRFQVDLNRPRTGAVYGGPQEAWGLDVWRVRPDEGVIAESLEIYDGFYATLRRILDDLQRRYGGFVLLDLHSYNFRRAGPDAPPEDPARNPDINVGTGGMQRDRWAPLVEAFMDELRRHEYRGRPLDVRENVRFRGGHLPKWVNATFPDGCALAVEVKKIFMDEWTGMPFPGGVEAIQNALAATVPLLGEHLERR